MAKKADNTAADVPEEIELRLYEVCLLYPYPVNQKEEQDMLKEINVLFKEIKAEEVDKDVWGKRGLAYPIGGYNQGNYIILWYKIDPKKIKELDHNLSLIKGLLRHMIVKIPADYEIVKYSELYEQWEKQKLTLKYRKEKKKSERMEKLQEKVVNKAKKQAQKRKEEKAAGGQKTEVSGSELNKKLEEIISDDDLEL